MTRPRILVIAGGGLERFVPALGAAAAIRAHHSDAEIVLLTTPDLAAFAATAPYFNDVWIDETRGVFDISYLWRLRKKLRTAPFARVYDLEDSRRGALLFRLMYGFGSHENARCDIAWSGGVAGTALVHPDHKRRAMHIQDRLVAQLKIAGITDVPRPDVSWVARRVEAFHVPFRMTDKFVLMVGDAGPGSAWPPDHYAELAGALKSQKVVPVLVGLNVLDAVRQASSETGGIDLAGRMSINELVFLSWAAAGAIGADTGVMHLAAAAGSRAVLLYDMTSDPTLTGHRGEKVRVLRRPRLSEIGVSEAVAALQLGGS